MSINTSARNYKILIGAQDWTPALLEISNWQTTAIDNSGLIRTTATLTLIETRDNPGSLDDRKNYLFRLGQQVTIDVANESGVLQRHPAGTLRLLSAEYNEETNTLTLQLGCLITLLSYRQPTDPNKAEITPGSFTPRNDIVYRLLNAAGISNISNPYFLSFPINYPINIGGSYLSTVGSLLYSAGYFGWMNKNEAFAIAPIVLSGSAAITLRIGGDNGDELFYRRLSSPESPREVIEVRGVARVASIPEYPSNTTNTRYGAANTIDSSLGSYDVIVSQQQVTENWNESSGVRTIQTTTQAPIGLTLPNQTYPDPIDKLALISTENRIETYLYELGNDGKLISTHIQTFKIQALIFAEYFAAKKTEGTEFTGTRDLVLAEEIFIDYVYNKNQLVSIGTTTYQTKGELLTGTNEDWSTYPLPPTTLRVAESITEGWTKGLLKEWTHYVNAYKSLALLKPELITEETTTNQKLDLLADSQNSIRETSNSGQTVPPAPERRPPKAGFEDKQVCGKARFPQHGGNPYKERERTYQIDYLQGRLQTQADIDAELNQDEDTPELCNDAQCEQIALIEGKLLYGRFKGQDIGTYLSDRLYERWQPLMRVNVVEPDGTVRAFCIDDSHWSLDVDQCLCNFSLIWIFDVSNGALSLPYSIGWDDLNGPRWDEVVWDTV